MCLKWLQTRDLNLHLSLTRCKTCLKRCYLDHTEQLGSQQEAILPPPPRLSVLSATPPAGINLSLPRVLMARTPRTWGVSNFHRGWREGRFLQLARETGSINRWVRRRCVIICCYKKKYPSLNFSLTSNPNINIINGNRKAKQRNVR